MGFCIGLDLMGGDNPPELLFPAIIEAAKRLSSKQSLLIFATQSVNDQLFSLIQTSLSSELTTRISFKECREVITMADTPLTAIRHKKNSSLMIGMKCLKEKEIQALVSCGNTGALIACSAIYLPLLPNISHPALLVHMPTERGNMALLDAGGSVHRKAQQLVCFAFLGAAYQKALHGINKPVVGLLNVGAESHKGTAEVAEAYGILKHHCAHPDAVNRDTDILFAGNIEGRDIFKGMVDVLVTDGFTGNILLKTAEGTATFLLDTLQHMLGSHNQDALNDLKKQFNYAEYPGAIICGVEGIVIKVHGNATSESLLASLLKAVDCVEKDILRHIDAHDKGPGPTRHSRPT